MKHTIGQKLKLTHRIDVEILRSEKFSGVDHYAIRYLIGKVGQPTEISFGWIPAQVLEAMDTIEM